MSNLSKVFNDKTKERIIRRLISIILRHVDDLPWSHFMCSAIVFKGYLITLKIADGKFQVLLTENDNYVVLFQRNCRYSLVNFSKCAREWLELVLFNDKNPYNPIVATDIKQFEVYNNPSGSCTFQELRALEEYKFGISYY